MLVLEQSAGGDHLATVEKSFARRRRDEELSTGLKLDLNLDIIINVKKLP